MAYTGPFPLPVVIGGTGVPTLGIHGVLVGQAAGDVNVTTAGTTGQVLIGSTGADPAFGALGVNSGLTSNGVVIANNNLALTATAAGTTGQVLTAVTAGAPTFQSPAASSITIAGDTGGGLTGNSFTFTGGTTGLKFGGSGTTQTVSGTLAIANGGTNAASMATTFGTIIYDGTRLVTTAVGSSNQVLTSNAALTAPTYQSLSSLGATTSFGTGSGTATPSSGVITIAGTTNQITTTGSGSTVTIAVPSSPSFGGTTTVATGLTATTGAITATAGNVVITAGNLTLPNTNAAGTQGLISLGGSRFINNFGTQNTFIGLSAGNLALTTASATGNAAVGNNTLTALTTGSGNCAFGGGTLLNDTTGIQNSGFGNACLFNVIGGSKNCALGFQVLNQLTTGNYNIGLGTPDGTNGSGVSYTSSESSNIVIANSGTTGESNVIRIGTTGTGNGQQSKCFIAGIFGVTVGVSGLPVVVDNTGNLGTVVSSKRFKENIEDLDDTNVLDLNPVSFNYKADKSKSIHYGLIAEDVENVFPQLVVYDDLGLPMSVKYQDLPVLLLHEIKQLAARIEELEERINGLMDK
jgi:hypothetical protein